MTSLINVILISSSLSLPNPLLTPGEVISTNQEIACDFTHIPRPRFSTQQLHQIFGSYNIPLLEHHNYELDHLIPRCLGGADSIKNIWPQPLDQAKIKDSKEKYICKLVCKMHSISLLEGQRYFTFHLWLNQIIEERGK